MVFVIVEEKNQEQQVYSPMVGRAILKVEEGAIVQAGDYLGDIECVHHHYPLHLPQHLKGYFELKGVKKTPYLLQYKSEIIKLKPAFLGATSDQQAMHHDQGQNSVVDQGFKRYECALDGTFYRRATPDSAAFIEEGMIIQPKQVIALVEVMKFFYQLQFEGKTAVKVEKIYAKDGMSVLGGDLLFTYSDL